jgi:hypothetical protein
MKKVSLSLLLFATVLMFQNCKKSSTDDTTTTTATPLLTALINSNTWSPDTVSANITYNAAAKTKTLNVSGTLSQKQVTFAVTLKNATSTNDFTAGTYIVDATPNPLMQYSTQQKDGTGAYVFVPYGTTAEGNGTVIVTSVDATNKLMTGTFSFISRKTNYDGDGNITSISIANVTSGAFTNLPYTFVSN